MSKSMFTRVLSAVLVMALFAGAALSGEKKGPFKVGYTAMDGSNPFFVIIEKTMRGIVEGKGDTFIATDPANDVTRQINQIEDMIAQNLDIIILNPVDAEGIRPALDQLKQAGVPIINFDAEVKDMDYLASYVGSDNYNAGKVCGDDLVKRLPNGGPILILDSPTMQSVVDRVNGFEDAIRGKGFTIVGRQDARGNLELGMRYGEDLLQANPNVVAIFGGNDPTALGALAAAKAAGLKDVLIYGVDGSPDIKAEIASGKSLIAGSGAQSPVTMAKMAVDIAYKFLAGEKVDARYPVPTFMINADNVAQYGVEGWQ